MASGSAGQRALRHLALVRRKRREHLALLALGNMECIEGSGKLSGHFVELLGGDPEVAVRFLEPEHVVPGDGR